MNIRLIIIAVASLLITHTSSAQFDATGQLSKYNVIWSRPSPDASGAMPIGNGEVGLNGWVEPGGDLVFLVARTDAWSETCRLLKLGRVRISITPGPLTQKDGAAPVFRQTLDLPTGSIEILLGDDEHRVSMTLFVDADQPVVHIIGTAAAPVTIRATVECWRTERKSLSANADELKSSWTMHSAPATVEVWESPDVFVEDPGAVSWYHRNEHSVVPLTLRHQGLESIASDATDPLIHRTFGGRLSGEAFDRVDRSTIASHAPTRRFALRLTTHSAQTDTPNAWLEQLRAIDRKAATAEAARNSTATWWEAFWKRSWIFVDGDTESAIPTNAHKLRLGIDAEGGNRFVGEFGRVQMFGDVLDDDRIAQLSRSQSSSLPTSDSPPVIGAWSAGTEPGATVKKDPPPTSALTIAAWIKPASDLRTGRIVDKITPGGSDGLLFDIQPNATLRLIVGNATLAAAGSVTLGEWSHATATVDAATGALRLFVNGNEVARRDGDEAPGPSRVTRGYILQRWMQACAGRGAYPIKFNGSIFTVEPRHSGGPDFNPDYRRWGDCYWWQNSRLPCYSMLAAGDFEMMQPLFSLYAAAVPLCEARARLYHLVRGAYFPETMTIFGTYSNGDYGWNRTGHEARDVLCPWWQYAWNQGPELLALMLDYWDYTHDRDFLKRRLLPMARSVLDYFDSRFARDAAGKLIISPTQALETHWHKVVNDAPCVAGLHDVLGRLRKLPADAVAADDRAFWTRLSDALPPIPTIEKNGVRMLAAAERFDPGQQNVETPELYAVFPFRLYGLGKPDLELARAAYRVRPHRFTHGWSQDGQFAALLGFTDDARANVLAKSRNSNAGHRFPAMWGPNFDWVPDQDHGSNLMTTLQLMLMQTDGDSIRLLPAWPAEWNVSFRLHAPRNTVVEGEYRQGRLVRLDVTPAERRKDVEIAPPAMQPDPVR
ncbi:MAG: hypothetical protein AMXMBFR47_15000 [Planctomycetota bacterium]